MPLTLAAIVNSALSFVSGARGRLEAHSPVAFLVGGTVQMVLIRMA